MEEIKNVLLSLIENNENEYVEYKEAKNNFDFNAAYLIVFGWQCKIIFGGGVIWLLEYKRFLYNTAPLSRW